MTQDPVLRAVAAYERAQSALDSKRTDLYEVIVNAVLVEGRRQSEIARLTGFSREHIRRLCVEAVETQASIDDHFDPEH